jgi:hypothetical protein
VLLREQGDEVHAAVAIDIDRDDVDAAGARIDRASREGGMGRAERLVLEDGDRARLAPAKRRDGEIELAVAVEVGGVDAGDAAPLL